MYDDEETFAFYAKEASAYAARAGDASTLRLKHFMAALPAHASVLELGCGGGHDAKKLIDAGFDVTPSDGSPELAAEATKRLGRPVRVMRFHDLAEHEKYDAVWAKACLLHVPRDGLGEVLARIWRSLKPDGFFVASFKSGDREERDQLGRYYNFPSADELRAAYEAAGAWRSLSIESAAGGGYDGVPRTWLWVAARK